MMLNKHVDVYIRIRNILSSVLARKLPLQMGENVDVGVVDGKLESKSTSLTFMRRLGNDPGASLEAKLHSLRSARGRPPKADVRELAAWVAARSLKLRPKSANRRAKRMRDDFPELRLTQRHAIDLLANFDSPMRRGDQRQVLDLALYWIKKWSVIGSKDHVAALALRPLVGISPISGSWARTVQRPIRTWNHHLRQCSAMVNALASRGRRPRMSVRSFARNIPGWNASGEVLYQQYLRAVRIREFQNLVAKDRSNIDPDRVIVVGLSPGETEQVLDLFPWQLGAIRSLVKPSVVSAALNDRLNWEAHKRELGDAFEDCAEDLGFELTKPSAPFVSLAQKQIAGIPTLQLVG